MNHEHHIQELRMQIEHMKKEPPQNWLGKWAKSIKIKHIENKILSLEKELKKIKK